MKTVLVVFGTRPEAIKMCPLVKELKRRKGIRTVVCVSGQHRELLASVLEIFGVVPDYDLCVMKAGQTLFDVTCEVLNGLKQVLNDVMPHLVLVHGDTSTAFAASLACFYMRIPVGHVEAGLRSNDIYNPYPEELNRKVISMISYYDFSPTVSAKNSLIAEGKNASRIFVTGNTAIDALSTTVRKDYNHEYLKWASDRKLVLLTSHRRENIGAPMRSIFSAVGRVAKERNDICIIYPVHPNPSVKRLAHDVLGGVENIRLVEPLDVIDFHNFMSRSYLILSDSGGVQEEAPSLKKPVLVLRDTTERPEGVKIGALKLVGTEEESVYNNFKLLLEDMSVYEKMIAVENPYGDGHASERISDVIGCT